MNKVVTVFFLIVVLWTVGNALYTKEMTLFTGCGGWILAGIWVVNWNAMFRE